MNEIWVIDWKSSTGVYEEMKTQVATYFKINNRTNEVCASRVGILRLDKTTGMLDNPPIVEVTDIEERWNAFLGLREYYRWAIEPAAKQDRWYPVNGKKYPTITTILDVLNKPALTQWSANMTCEYFRENMKYMSTPEQIEYHLKKAKTAYRTMSKKAMDIGSVVHDAIHAHLSGAKPEPILEGNEAATNAFLAFIQWADSVNLKPIYLEKVLIDPEYEIGGTTDCVCELTLQEK